MSSMLEQAIIDAEALREVALKNAESAVIEKYSTQIKEAVEEILTNPSLNEEEEEEVGSEVVDNVAYASADDHEHDDDCGCEDREEEEITLDLTDLLTQMKDDEESGNLDADEMQDREAVADEIVNEEVADEEIELDESALQDMLGEETIEEEEVDAEVIGVPNISEESLANMISEIVSELSEEVKVDIADPLPKSGWSETKPALSQTEEYQEPLESEIERVKETTTENKKLQAQNKKLNETLNKVHKTLVETNTSNARLLYTNKVLTSSSLNERQKIKIVEALSKASSVEEAKIIFETLQSAVGTSANIKQPQSLSEAVTRNSSTYLPKSESKKDKTSPATDRWKILAGI
jgi:hypothetical protein